MSSHGVLLTQELLKESFEYHEDGNLIWKVKKNGCNIGNVAGCILKLRDDLRRVIVFNRRNYIASNLIFFYHKGYIPECVDHIDRDTLNDRIGNLRAASKTQNNRNRTSAKNSSSKYLGVYRVGKKWRVETSSNGVKYSLGRFEKEEDAAEAYNKKAKELFGEFANLNIIEK